MPAPSVTIEAPPPTRQHDPGVLRPQSRVFWSGGTGPTYDVLHEWDTVTSFDSGDLIQVSHLDVSGPSDTAVPSADLGPGGVTWHYRVTVTDDDDGGFTTTGDVPIVYADPIDYRRYLYELINVGVGFSPIDEPSAGDWITDPPDGFAIAFRRYLYELVNLGVGFDPTDTPAAGWDGAGGGEPGDGYTIDFRRYLYELANINTDTPTPHIWYLFPAFGREGWEFQIVGYGFGDTQATFSGTVTLNGLAVGVISWELVAEAAPTLIIDPVTNTAEPVHQLIRASVPQNAESGLVVVCTDGP